MLMKDKNGVEIKKGDVVVISGAYFKNDNGMWVVDHAPGDPGWYGSDYCLKKLNKNGSRSQAKHNICFWPIMISVNSYEKRWAAEAHNKKYAQIEVVA